VSCTRQASPSIRPGGSGLLSWGGRGCLVPEELGGGSVSGNGVADLAMVAEQIGKTVAPGPLYPVSTVLADCALCRA